MTIKTNHLEEINCYERGFSIIELVLVASVVGVLAMLIANLPSSVSSINRSRHASIAKDAATKKIENIRKLSYDSLANGSNGFTEDSLNSLPKVNATYSISDCAPPICNNSEEAKVVSITVSWNESGDSKSVNISTIISQGGLVQ